MKGENQPIIRKEKIKEYKFVKNIFLRGGVGAIILFLLFTINNTIWTALWCSIIVWMSWVLIFFFIFYRSEYYERSVIKKSLRSHRYSFFNKCDFEITKEMTLNGCYKGYEFNIIPITSVVKKMIKVQYDVIETYYEFTKGASCAKKEENMSGEYFIGKIIFENQKIYLIPSKWDNPNFEEILNGLINILSRENLRPITKKEWENHVQS